MSRELAQLGAEHEALTQFLYLAPVGLVQADLDGDIALMNPIAAQLMMPLSRTGALDNLFAALDDVAPELRVMCERYDAPSGKICDGLHLHLPLHLLPNGGGARGAPQTLSLTLLKLDAHRVMAVLSDITEQLRRERRLRQNDAWMNAILSGICDYALANLDLEGRICEWNQSIGRVTGFGPEIVGQPYSLFYPQDAMRPEGRLARLRAADANGWSMDQGHGLRADGGSFRASALIAPLPERESLPGQAVGPAYCLIVRDIGDKVGLTDGDIEGCTEQTPSAARRADLAPAPPTT